jgi:chorismate mutase
VWCRGIRGATTADENSKEAILDATKELLRLIVSSNTIEIDQVASVSFTTTQDLNAEFPAAAAREMGWEDTALLCGHEMNVPNGLPMCIRVLLLINTEKKASELKHVYIKGARNLRS